MTSSYKNLERAIVEELKQDDQLTVCQLFVNLQRTEHSWRDLQDERNACVHNNASFNTNNGLGRSKKSSRHNPPLPECRATPKLLD